MKVVLLAGGFGTRISEESHLKPKPMIEIDGMPILWHIMKCYSQYGFNEFIICCGYKQHVIKEFFDNYFMHCSDVTFDFSKKNRVEVHNTNSEPWKVTVIDTGLNTMTGGRVKRIENYVNNETFMLTYGDGVCDINLNELLDFHKKNGKIATLTAIQPGGRFGALEIDNDNSLRSFAEKKKEDGGWINGGFMVLEPEVFKYIEGDETVFEREPLESLVKENQIVAYKHKGFWQCMDTMRDKEYLESLLRTKKAPWKIWE